MILFSINKTFHVLSVQSSEFVRRMHEKSFSSHMIKVRGEVR